jgi:hypothetical protein
LNVSPTSSPVAALSIVPSKDPRAVAPSLADAPRQTDATQVRDSAGRATSDVAAPASRYALAHLELSTGDVVGLGHRYELVVRMDPPRSIGRPAFTVIDGPANAVGTECARRCTFGAYPGTVRPASRNPFLRTVTDHTPRKRFLITMAFGTLNVPAGLALWAHLTLAYRTPFSLHVASR